RDSSILTVSPSPSHSPLSLHDALPINVEPKHYRIMLACVESCRTAAHIMLLDTPLHRETCGACAKICEACAQSCREVGGMEKCVEACEQCAAICREMAGH